VGKPTLVIAGLDRQSINEKKPFLRRGWMRGSQLGQKASPGSDGCGRRSFSEAGKPAHDDPKSGRSVP
jgi:hypothetical protein